MEFPGSPMAKTVFNVGGPGSIPSWGTRCHNLKKMSWRKLRPSGKWKNNIFKEQKEKRYQIFTMALLVTVNECSFPQLVLGQWRSWKKVSTMSQPLCWSLPGCLNFSVASHLLLGLRGFWDSRVMSESQEGEKGKPGTLKADVHSHKIIATIFYWSVDLMPRLLLQDSTNWI